MKIHPTAIIDPSAELGTEVEIGAYAVVAGGTHIGAGTVLHPHVVVHRGVRLGEQNVVCAGAILGGLPQDLGFRAETPSRVEIGHRNTLREHVTIHRGSKENGVTRVGDECFLMAGAHLGHDVQVGHGAILANNVLLGGHAKIGDRVFLGGGSVVHQSTEIGRLAILQGISGVSKDVPPFCLVAERNSVAGLNVIGLRRAGMDSRVRMEIKKAFNLIFRGGLNVHQALEAARQQGWGAEATEFLDFITNSKRGICGLLRRERS